MNKTKTIRGAIGRIKPATALLSMLAVAAAPPILFADSLSLTTWYPAPYGVYSQLRSTGNSYFAYQGGSVGIGTTSPAANYKLHLVNSAGDAMMRLEGGAGNSAYLSFRDAGGTNANAYMGTENSAGGNIAPGTQPYSFVINQSYARNIQFGTNNQVRATIDSSGNVGIGTKLPVAPLHLWADTPGINTMIRLASRITTQGQGPMIDFQYGTDGSADTDGGYPGYTSARIGMFQEVPGYLGGALVFFTAYATKTPVERMRVSQNGNVGIGTTVPGAKLQVGSSGDGSYAVANAWNTFSSRRYKENIQPIGGALDKISRLRGVEFEWKGSGKRDLGVVAEEVGQVFPEIVDYETGGRDARGLDYSKLVAPLIEAVKEQQDEILTQQRQIKTQSARIEALEKTLAEVRRK